MEASLEVQNRRSKEGSKGYKFQKYTAIKTKEEPIKTLNKEGQYYRPWQPKTNYTAPTYEQRKELGLCHKCHGKYFPGHQCSGKVMSLLANTDKEAGESEEDKEDSEPDDEQVEMVEQVMISMFTSRDKGKLSSMRFEGHISKVPICALLDSGSTHSFANPKLVKRLKIPTIQTNPMVVRVANGECMVTDTICKELKFDLQGYEFEKDVRLLTIQGYDIILGLDWLTGLGPMKIDWSRGTLKFKLKDQNVKLQVRNEMAELTVIDTYMDVEKEIKKGNEVIFAQFFRIEEKESKGNLENQRVK